MTHEPFSNYYWHVRSAHDSDMNDRLREVVSKVEAYRAELIKRGQADELAQEYVKVAADRLGSILRPLDD